MRLLVHAGAGNISPDSDLLEIETDVRAGLEAAVRLGAEALDQGGSSLDAVAAAVASMEDCPFFNAGRGSVLNADGGVEMDASIMEGKTLRAGAVALVSTLKNPVRAARAVLESDIAVLMGGPGAERFAAEHGCETERPDYFVTPYWRERWAALKNGGAQLDHSARSEKHGTVGAVALDRAGNLAAATSSGGLLNKTPGRIGDSPVPGAGVYAANAGVAVSFTGTGEHILRTGAGRLLSALVESGALGLNEAADAVLADVSALGGQAGFIAIDRCGAAVTRCNASALLRGWLEPGGAIRTAIFMAEPADS